MTADWTGGLLLALAVGLLAWLLIAQQPKKAVAAVREKETAGGAPRYTILATAGHTLIVTDNKTNTLYFYTIDKGQEVFTDLKLRSALDLTRVGEPVLKPKTSKKEK